ncbi:NAD(P)/FAD-dependent oxidoreductase [Jannaschia seohaensis]|uniref:Glycine/D-amino acid oxidase n=1 Tax=Jannaschia seohaensis TaxID=475081 RepID=A0A2Y9AVM6_9RHOB|nr:FAD-dependent oxidoreductase [Jannaschia seohaensis]PWJ17047.1 glycine/D-amino acid oxidase-like deaminating enzyme [Jannaschia seohaensis]SSA48384.1 Glycine/D-amino acid oxidase [Jannaschia seohaensis]
MTPPDVLVIGGGIIGRVAAIELATAGATVTIVDAGTNAGSHANAGSLHVQMQSRFIRLFPEQAPNVEAALPLYKQAASVWADLEARIGDCELTRQGGLMLAEGEAQMAFLEDKARREERRGLDVTLLDRAALDRIAPWIGAQIVGAELCRDEGKLNPLLAGRRLEAECRRLGITVVTDSVQALERAGGGMVAHGRRSRYAAQEVVIAAAWGSGVIVRDFGVDIPTRAEPLHMNITEPCAYQIAHLVQHAERPITFKQFKSGQIVIGGGWPARDNGPDAVPSVRADSLLGNVALAARLVPAVGRLRLIRTWAGMNTTADGGSILGRLAREPRVTMAVPGDAGYTLGPLIGQMAASIVLGQAPPADPAPYAPDRFAAATA